MKEQFVSHFAFTTLVAALNLLGSPISAAAQVSQENPSPSQVIFPTPLPAACQVVYPTKVKAQRSCPANAPVIEWYEFWQHTPHGWVCDCTQLTHES